MKQAYYKPAMAVHHLLNSDNLLKSSPNKKLNVYDDEDEDYLPEDAE